MQADWDPEDDREQDSGSEEQDPKDTNRTTGREHYESLGESSLRKFEELDVDLDDDYKGLGVRRGDLEFLNGDGSQYDSEEASQERSQAGEESEEQERALSLPHHIPNKTLDSEGTKVMDDESFSGFESDHADGTSSSNPSVNEYENGFDISDADSATSALSPFMSSEEDKVDRDGDADADETAKVRALLSTDASKIKASLTAAARSDIEKGRAIKRQRIAFDSLLNTRIKLQKALVASNTLATLPSLHSAPQQEEETDKQRKAQRAKAKEAEKAALSVWNDLHALRKTYLPTPEREADKHDPPSAFTVTPSTPTSTMWAQMQQLESTARPARRATLAKWAEKTTPLAPSSSAMGGRNKIGQTRQPSLLSTLDAQLAGLNLERLVQGSRVLRSCGAPGLTRDGQRSSGEKEGAKGEEREQEQGEIQMDRGRENVYDDSGFYASLLRELVEQRSAASSTIAGSASAAVNGTNGDMPDVKVPSNRDLRVRKQVDRKASKGRKMRYQVHEKLQNFMVAEDRGTWGERQRGELFASLFGRKADGGENGDGQGEEGGMEVDGSEEEGEGGGLRLFG